MPAGPAVTPEHKTALNMATNDRISAVCSILYHESITIGSYAVQLGLAPSLQQHMLSQVRFACGASDPAVLDTRMRIGEMLYRLQPAEPWAKQLADLRNVLYVRTTGQASDWRWYGYLSSPPPPNDVTYRDPDVRLALWHRLHLNQQHIDHLKKCEAMIAALVPPSLGGTDYRTHMHTLQNASGPAPGPAPAPTSGSATAPATAARRPLASLAPNVAGQGKQSAAPTALAADKAMTKNPALKRKREDPPKKVVEVISLLEDSSDDEAALQAKSDALEARIASIRARTGHEDQVLATKRPKSTPKPPLASQRTPLNVPPVTQRAPPIVQGPTALTRGSFDLPPSSQHPVCNMRVDYTKIKDPRWAAHLRDGLEGPDASGMTINELRDEFEDIERKRLAREKKAAAKEKKVEAQKEQRRAESAGRAAVTGTIAPGVHPSASQSLARTTTQSQAPIPATGTFSSSPAMHNSMPPILISSSPSTQQPVQPTPAEVRTEPVLCKEQQSVVDLIKAGHNVFYTGSAGCGKSTVLKSFVPMLRDMGKTVKIIAPTGRAALDINGMTTWTFAGWTPSHFKKPLEELKTNAHGKFVSKRFKDTDVLVIDEISMVENHMLARLDAILRHVRCYNKEQKPFGGVQIIVTGDFCQLPPVKPFQYCMVCGFENTQRIVNGKTIYRCRTHGDQDDDNKWAFKSRVWEECKFHHVNLSQIHRQSDEVFIKILQKLRVGTPLSTADRTLLLDHPCDVTNAVKLFPTREQVKRINDTEFNLLPTAKHCFTCLDHFDWNEQHGNLKFKGARDPSDDSIIALRDHKLDNYVELKTGMLVVLLVNLDIDAGLVNGSQGRVLGFERYLPSKLPKAIVRETSSSRPVGGSKKKGASGRFSSSQRGGRDGSPEPRSTTSMQGELRGEHALLREKLIREFLERPCNKSKLWPLVEFDNGVKRTIFADCQVNELGDEQPYTLLARTQIPLIAAWAMTIHKSQGMTLNRVIVDLGSSFEEGQAYVALSRARSLEGLRVLSLGQDDGKGGNPQVRQFLWEKFGIK
ncbi:unnamed protein product [Zymoseptoria tritici ST99CH_3D7]|uniref:ATP-dependent DNA helicase n=1 Tax=Zymoseptoria tritici (strain ST99CH_3D7) TaxID=1276538 RepID=A0A1X7S4U4_ZYMT9|nr:unnamed protein product [Zymoseptoria tritici ST99CH_3D7]